jgi:hypothetical protein
VALASTRSAVNVVPGDGAKWQATYTVTASGGTDSTVANPPAAAQGPIDVSGFTEIAVDIFLSAITGTSITFSVDRQGTDGRWYNLGSGTALTTASTTSSSTAAVVGGTSFSIGMSGPTNASVGRGIRVRWVGATLTSATFTVSIIGK